MIGLEDYDFLPLNYSQYYFRYVSGALLTTNTFGAMALTAVALPLLSLLDGSNESGPKSGFIHPSQDPSQGREGRGSNRELRSGLMGNNGRGSLLALSVASYLTVRSLTACAMVICATVLHKNVVVWAIIAPKFVFELFFVSVAALASAVGVLAFAA